MPQNISSGIDTSEELGCMDSNNLALTKEMQISADMICMICHAGDIQDIRAWVLRAIDM